MSVLSIEEHWPSCVLFSLSPIYFFLSFWGYYSWVLYIQLLNTINFSLLTLLYTVKLLYQAILLTKTLKLPKKTHQPPINLPSTMLNLRSTSSPNSKPTTCTCSQISLNLSYSMSMSDVQIYTFNHLDIYSLNAWALNWSHMLWKYKIRSNIICEGQLYELILGVKEDFFCFFFCFSILRSFSWCVFQMKFLPPTD